MPKFKEIAKKRSAPSKVLRMAFPDAETLAFWKMTADDAREYAARIAKFSRIVGKNAVRNAVRSSERRRRDPATAVQSRRSETLGRVLVMPNRSDLGSRSCFEAGEQNTEILQGGNMKAPGVRARKRGTKLKRGAATQVMVYPRQKTKGVLVAASRDISRPLSSFIILAALKEAAALRGCEIKDLIPADELERYRKSRVYRKRSKAAQ